MSKDTTPTKPKAVEPEKQWYTLPELGLSVEAVSVADAVAKAKKIKETK